MLVYDPYIMPMTLICMSLEVLDGLTHTVEIATLWLHDGIIWVHAYMLCFFVKYMLCGDVGTI